MRNAARLRPTSCILLASLASVVGRPVEASSLAQTQLAGLKGVNLTVSVGRDLPDVDALEKEIRAQAKEILARADLSDDGPDGVWFSIEVTCHPSDEKLRPGVALVHVRVELTEHVRLDRDRSIKVPQGAVTWSEESVSIESKLDLRDFVMKQVAWSVGLFTDTVKSVRRLPDREVRDRSR